MATRKLYVDVQNACLVESFTQPNRITTPAPFTIGDTIDLEIYFVLPADPPSATAPLSYYSIPLGATLKLGVKDADPDDFEATDFLAYLDVFADISNGKSGTLDLNTTPLADPTSGIMATTDESHDVWFEFEMTVAGAATTLIRWKQTLNNQVIDTAAAPSPAGPSYYTEAEVDALLKGGNDATKQFGKVALANGASSKSVVFTTPQSSANIHFECLYIQNISADATKYVVHPFITALDASGFTVAWSADLNTGNYYLVYKTRLDP